jgi:hypothetical protein
MKELVPKSFRSAGVLAIVAGLILIASGVTSGSILLTGLGYVDNYLGSSIGSAGQFVLQLAIGALTFLVGLGGLSVIVGGVLLLLKHGSAGRFLSARAFLNMPLKDCGRCVLLVSWWS